MQHQITNKKINLKPHIKPEVSAVVKPSNIPLVKHCQGSALLQHATRHETVPSPAAEKGKTLHAIAAFNIDRMLLNPNKHMEITDDIPEEDDFVKDYIKGAVANAKQADFVGTELGLHDTYNNILVSGFADFVCYNAESKTLIIKDLKTGYGPISKDAKYQLYIYALAFINMLEPPHSVEFVELYLNTRFQDYLYRPTIEELILFKSELASKLSDFSFKIGSHCADCYQFKHCSFAVNIAHKILTDAIIEKKENLKNILEFEPILLKFIKEAKAKLIDLQINNQKTFDWVGVKTKKKQKWKEDAAIPTITIVNKKLTVLQAKKKGLEVDHLTETYDEHSLEIKK